MSNVLFDTFWPVKFVRESIQKSIHRECGKNVEYGDSVYT